MTGSGEVHVLRRTGSSWVLSQTIVPTGPNQIRFGSSIVIKGTLMFVGSPMAGPVAGLGVGAVYVYSLVGTEWVQTSVIDPPPPAGARNYFGETLDFDGQRLVVGAYFRSPQGAAFVYEKVGGTWTLTATLLSPYPDVNGFGTVVAIDGSVAVVAEFLGRHLNVFELRNGVWAWTANLEPATGPTPSYPGTLDVSEDRILVGGPASRNGVGSAFVYERVGASWAQTATLLDNAGGIHSPARFGSGVVLRGDSALVGSPRLQRALLFTFDGTVWTRSAVFGVDETPQLRFGDAGQTVGLDGNRALLGAPRARVEGTSGAGAVHAFDLGPTGGRLVADVTLGPGRSGHRFGTDVALSGNRVAVCAQGSDYVFSSSTPSVYVFSVTGGAVSMETRIAVPCAAVALGPDQMFVGSPVPGSTGVRVYTRGPSGWTQSQTLFQRGSALSFDGNRLLVGAPGTGNARGYAYLYERAGTAWELALRFQTPIPEDSVSFGTSVALDGARIVIGAPRSTLDESSVGLAHVYEHTGGTWERVAVLRSLSHENDGLFGTSVAVSGGRALVSALSPPDGDGGGAYVFDGLAWSQTASLGGPGPGSSFGADVALDGGRALVGARIDADSLGRAFLYGYYGTSWLQTAALESPSPVDGEEFGASVAIEGRRFAVGAPHPVRFGRRFGAVYLYRDQMAVADETGPVADAPRLLAPRPNPASRESRLTLRVGQPERVTVSVYDALGRSVQTVMSGESVVGEVVISVDARALALGLYVVRVVGETFVESATLVVAR